MSRTILIAGVDEAGRGPLAGPVVAAVVVLEQGQLIEGVTDSKKLTAARREQLEEVIRKEARSWAVAEASVAEIDELNILQASMLAMRRAIDQLDCPPDTLNIDGNRCPPLPPGLAEVAVPLVGGDSLCPATGAASILAKVERDRQMLRLHERYPQYAFHRHKGYPTAVHRDALMRFGATPEHRRSFRPVRELLAAGESAA